jgi:sterol desaturase/sphingolipid hydroxylase (fatty acid hydroxylase superfamily)
MESTDQMESQDSIDSADQEPKHFGTGWISGVLSVLLGFIGLLAVFCFHYPQLLTMPELRTLYPVPYIRALLQLVLIASFGLGVLSIYLRRDKSIGGIGILLTLIAALFGGSRVPIEGELVNGPFLGLDWFLLNLIAFSLIFVPLEQLFPHRRTQPIFRTFWKTDLAYFFVSAIFVQVTTVLTLKPAVLFFEWAVHPGIRSTIGGQPYFLQFAEILLIADLTQYWVHRLFHSVPFLWRFHAIHHSAESMDWLAGSRLHIIDIAVTRGISYIPIYLLGFSEAPLFAYIIFVSIHATFIHSNFRIEFGPLRHFLVIPRFHHWHHTSDLTHADKNFAVHLPVLDRLFGTHYLPSKDWPAEYGVTSGGVPPSGFFAQLTYPFSKKGKA